VDLPSITPPDAEAQRAAVARHAELAVPVGGLGRLAELGCWLAAVQGSCPPRPPGRPRVIVVAADHGIAAAGVSRHSPSTAGESATLPQVQTVREHTAPVSVLAPVSGASIRVVDVGLDHESSDAHHVRRGSGRIDREDALTAEEVERAVAAGRAVVDEEVDGGADLIIPSSLGVGATTVASTLVSALTGAEPVAAIGRGSGIDDQGWMRKAAAVRDARLRARPHRRDPLALLRVVGGTDLAALTGMLLQAAVRKTPVLIDGLVVGAAAMLADELAKGARAWWLVAQRSPEPAMILAVQHLSLPPVLDLGIRTGDGTGAVAVLPLLQMAARVLAETATVADLAPA
jgi:nicotinate-nucleotide--dimethylbenzimidazole phosphoribosyltransferase